MTRIREPLAAVADLGTVLPILLALSALPGASASRAFAVFGAALLFTGWRYRIPVAVQPLKAVAAIVIVNELPVTVLPVTALAMAAILLLASATPVAGWLSRLPVAFIRGNQLAVGGLLVLAAARLAGLAGRAPAPVASGELWLLIAGLVIAQLPVTCSNAIAGTASLARDAFGSQAGRVSERRLLASTGAMNLCAAAFGGIPMCHGSSGLTAYRLWGARTAAPTVTLGGLFLAGGLFAGDAVASIAAAIPAGLLALGVAITGLRHAALIADRHGSDLAIAIVIGVTGFAAGTLTAGIAAGTLLLAARASLRRRVVPEVA